MHIFTLRADDFTKIYSHFGEIDHSNYASSLYFWMVEYLEEENIASKLWTLVL